MTATDFEGLLRRLLAADVQFILVGGVAAVVHGAARATFDIDVVYLRSAKNLDRLVTALGPLEPYLRGAPRGLPFRFDRATLQSGLNFTLETSLGDIDLFGEVAGGDTFETLVNRTVVLSVFDHQCRCVTLPALIELKRAAARPKDREAIAELEALVEETRKSR